jgi:phosphopantothenoylcysteine decarboxylase/phosphopantothenate--cysteine ligase
MLHITLAKSANLILIAPASANIIAKLSHASADCLLSTLCLATEAQIIVCPAMNKIMWDNTLVQKNIAVLKKTGMHIVGPVHGEQACGDIGFGRMIDPTEIIKYCQNLTLPKISQVLQGKKIIITAGPTREKIDPVRFLSNHSSGKMGYAIAQVAYFMGAEVVLITGPTALAKPSYIKIIQVESCEEMLAAVKSVANQADIFIGCAAVADYKPKNTSDQKIKKQHNKLTLELLKNTDIISNIKNSYPKLFCVGFAAETDHIRENGLIKLKQKNLDMIAINDVSQGQVFDQDTNELHVFIKNQEYHHIRRDCKNIIAEYLLKIIAQNFTIH